MGIGVTLLAASISWAQQSPNSNGNSVPTTVSASQFEAGPFYLDGIVAKNAADRANAWNNMNACQRKRALVSESGGIPPEFIDIAYFGRNPGKREPLSFLGGLPNLFVVKRAYAQSGQPTCDDAQRGYWPDTYNPPPVDCQCGCNAEGTCGCGPNPDDCKCLDYYYVAWAASNIDPPSYMPCACSNFLCSPCMRWLYHRRYEPVPGHRKVCAKRLGPKIRSNIVFPVCDCVEQDCSGCPWYCLCGSQDTCGESGYSTNFEVTDCVSDRNACFFCVPCA